MNLALIFLFNHRRLLAKVGPAPPPMVIRFFSPPTQLKQLILSPGLPQIRGMKAPLLISRVPRLIWLPIRKLPRILKRWYRLLVISRQSRMGSSTLIFHDLAGTPQAQYVLGRALPKYVNQTETAPPLVLAITQELNHGPFEPKTTQILEPTARPRASVLCSLFQFGPPMSALSKLPRMIAVGVAGNRATKGTRCAGWTSPTEWSSTPPGRAGIVVAR